MAASEYTLDLLSININIFDLGANKNIYYVCNEPGESWVKLPHVTPAEIVTSRKITKLLTGRLASKIQSYPIFPGTEANYLRALIARISATTHISPAGYYMFDEESLLDDEEDILDSFIVNTDFEGLPLREMIDSNMNNWVHHLQYILPQGNNYCKQKNVQCQ